MQGTQGASRVRGITRIFAVQFIIVVITLGTIEVTLRAIDLRFFRDAGQLQKSGGPGSRDILLFRHDLEIGWAPIPNSVATYVGSHPITVRHNSLGLRDIEHDRAPKPTILFLGDSIVWGYDVEAEDRFTERLREGLPNYRVVNAGVSGYGTDQEYLFLQRIWPQVEPNVVVLMFSVDTDRKDNTSNARYDFHYKPYFVLSSNGDLQLQGQPVPLSRHGYFSDNWLARHSWLARLGISFYLHVRYHSISIPDPTEHLVHEIRRYVETRGARFLVGLQSPEPKFEAFLQAAHIPYVSFVGLERYPSQGQHWTPKGHVAAASRLLTLLQETGAVRSILSAETSERSLPASSPDRGR